MNERLTLEFDGGSRGNPGPAAVGVVIRAEDGTAIYTLGRPIGRATNNVAEYRALITALQKAIELGASRVTIRGDSELVIKQMTGVYRVKHPDMQVLHQEAKALLKRFADFRIEHNLRHKNELADKLANLALDRKADVLDADDDRNSRPAELVQPGVHAASAGAEFSCENCGCAIEVKVTSAKAPTGPFVCQCGRKMVCD